jgi:hypothetical protein
MDKCPKLKKIVNYKISWNCLPYVSKYFEWVSFDSLKKIKYFAINKIALRE